MEISLIKMVCFKFSTKLLQITIPDIKDYGRIGVNIDKKMNL